MLKRKIKNNNQRKGQLFIVGSFLIIIGAGVLTGIIVSDYLNTKQEQSLINDFYEEQETIVNVPIIEDEVVAEESVEQEEPKQTTAPQINYIAVVKIPKIGLEKGLASKDSYYNNVNRNIQILSESDTPDVDKGNVILASHSGNSSVSYFRKLNKLQNEDSISIFYNGKEYKYKMVNSYEIEKNGYAHIVRNAEKSTLTLITCKSNTNKQLVVICELVEVL